MYHNFKQIIALIKNWTNKLDSKYLNTMNKLHSKEIICWLILKIIKNYGGKPACARLRFLFKRAKLIKHKFTEQAISQAAQKIPANEIANLSQQITKRFFNHSKDHRIIAVDGTKLSLSKNIQLFKDKQFPETISKSYRKGLLTVLYNIKTNAPIAYDLTTHMDERASFLRLKTHLRNGDILIFDRGYYSQEILESLINIGVNVVFRLSKTNKNIFNKQNIPKMSRVITYHIGDKDFTLLTTLSSNWTDEFIQHLYHDRWAIEEFYKFFKTNLNGNFYNLKLAISLEQTLEIQFLCAILIALVGEISKKTKTTASSSRISPKYTLEYLEEIVFELIYGSNGHLKFLKYICEHILENCLIKVKQSRSYPRTAIVNKGKWYRNQLIS